MTDRLARVLYLATLFALPWGALVPFPWLHENARWSDALFALAAARLGGRARRRAAAPPLPRRSTRASPSTSAGRACRSSPPPRAPRPARPSSSGVAMLVALFVVTSDMMGRPGMPQAVGRTLAVTSLLTALAAVAGVLLSYFGRITPLVGTCGDLLPGPLSRAQAGFPHPNLLASWCVFASGALAREDAGLSRAWRRVAQAALAVTVAPHDLARDPGLRPRRRRSATRPPRPAAASRGRSRPSSCSSMLGLTATNADLLPAAPVGRARPARRPRRASRRRPRPSRRSPRTRSSAPGPAPRRAAGAACRSTRTSPRSTWRRPWGCPRSPASPSRPGRCGAARARPTDLATWGMLAGLGLDGLGQDVEDFRHVWVALGLADDGREAPERPA